VRPRIDHNWKAARLPMDWAGVSNWVLKFGNVIREES
jgi:hypothetical protein